MRLFKNRLPCDKCDQRFSSNEELMQHLQIVHGKDIPYNCKLCNLDFTNMEDMRTHLQRYHSYKKD